MLNPTLLEQWQTPLHAQWQHEAVAAPIASLNYSCGGALGVLQLRGLVSDPAFMAAITSVFGVSLPTQPKQAVYAKQAALLWVSPDEWLLVCPHREKDALLQGLQTALVGVYAQILDNSGGFTLMGIDGSYASTVLRHLTPYDVLSLSVGECVQTFAHKNTFMITKVADNEYAVLFRRSFADYIWRLLQKTARPYGYAVQKDWHLSQSDWQRYTAKP